MTRYCKSCRSISKTQIPLLIAFIAVFFLKNLCFCHFALQRHTYIPTDTPDHFTPLRACAAQGKNQHTKSRVQGIVHVRYYVCVTRVLSI